MKFPLLLKRAESKLKRLMARYTFPDELSFTASTAPPAIATWKTTRDLEGQGI